ncbi:hypothetical protein LQZ21_06845 [Treponema sp. TIM-1]|uniref:hypothetical protein n=1 Tax=Treponema sp. TIM-1 TaxID=2898417 RepID=UPI00397F4BD4
MLNWIISNKEWVFGGIGIAVFGGIFTFLRWIFKKHDREKTNARNQSQKSGRNSTNIQIAGDLIMTGGVENDGNEPKGGE